MFYLVEPSILSSRKGVFWSKAFQPKCIDLTPLKQEKEEEWQNLKYRGALFWQLLL